MKSLTEVFTAGHWPRVNADPASKAPQGSELSIVTFSYTVVQPSFLHARVNADPASIAPQGSELSIVTFSYTVVQPSFLHARVNADPAPS